MDFFGYQQQARRYILTAERLKRSRQTGLIGFIRKLNTPVG